MTTTTNSRYDYSVPDYLSRNLDNVKRMDNKTFAFYEEAWNGFVKTYYPDFSHNEDYDNAVAEDRHPCVRPDRRLRNHYVVYKKAKDANIAYNQRLKRRKAFWSKVKETWTYFGGAWIPGFFFFLLSGIFVYGNLNGLAVYLFARLWCYKLYNKEVMDGIAEVKAKRESALSGQH